MPLGNWDKVRLGGPMGSSPDVTLTYWFKQIYSILWSVGACWSEFHSGCLNYSYYHLQQCFSGLASPGRSDNTFKTSFVAYTISVRIILIIPISVVSFCDNFLSGVFQLVGFGVSLLQNVDPNPENFVCAGIIKGSTVQIGTLLRLEPNRQAQVSRTLVKFSFESVKSIIIC